MLSIHLRTAIIASLTMIIPRVAPLAAQARAASLPPAPDCSAETAAPSGGIRLDCAALAAIEAAAQQLVSSARTPGLAVAIARGGQLVLAKGYGEANLETDTPVTVTTVFPIFSITKTFTAAGIMQLRDAGRLSLDDRVAKYFPDFPRGQEMSLRHLLSHTSGIHDYAEPGRAEEKMRMTPVDLVRLISSQSPVFDFDPGTKYAYSNSNFVLLGRIIEIVTGESYARYIQDSVIAKASLASTKVDQQLEVVRGRASGYQRTTVPGQFANGPLIDISFTFAVGNIRSTLPDLARWWTALYDGRIVSAQSLREMSTTAKLSNGQPTGGSWGSYGYGMELGSTAGHRWAGHGGATASFSSIARRYVDDDLLVVVFANSGRVAPEMAERIERIILASAGTKSATPAR
jgi:CubicO group peptidase (beta-lactamase class C family)